MEERSRQAIDAEALIAAEVDRFHQRQRTVNVAPAIVALQRKAEEIRVAEIERLHSRLGVLNAEQLAAVEALTRGLVNKFLHPPMQALKQAAREGDSVKLDALCEEWSVSSAAQNEAPSTAASPAAPNAEAVASPVSSRQPDTRKNVESATTSETGAEARR
jgi:glutamyl-tRNA reductase